jgi:hypothetical protein
MKLIERIEKQEILRLWAIGEVYVELLNLENQRAAREVLNLLISGDKKLEKGGIDRVLKDHHWSLIEFIPKDTVWYRARLEVNRTEFNKLNTLPVADLARITNNTFRLAYAATIVKKRPDLNDRISSIIEAMKKEENEVQLSGITLLAKDIDGPYTILEGNGRLIGLYHLEFIEKINKVPIAGIDVVIGFSDLGIA